MLILTHMVFLCSCIFYSLPQNGPGPEESLSVRTLSDIPGDTPHNFTVEPNSASV